MKMIRVLVQLPQPMKAQLEVLCRDGYTASGYIRALIERDLGRRGSPAVTADTGPRGAR